MQSQRQKGNEPHQRTEGRDFGAEGDYGKSEESHVVNPAQPYYKSKRANHSNHSRQ